MSTAPQVLLVDDHELVRVGVKSAVTEVRGVASPPVQRPVLGVRRVRRRIVDGLAAAFDRDQARPARRSRNRVVRLDHRPRNRLHALLAAPTLTGRG